MTLSKIKGPKTHFSKLRDQNMTFSIVKGPITRGVDQLVRKGKVRHRVPTRSWATSD